MTLEQVLNWLLLPALGGLAWIARSVSRLDTKVDVMERNITEIWKHVNEHDRSIGESRESIAKIQGRMERP